MHNLIAEINIQDMQSRRKRLIFFRFIGFPYVINFQIQISAGVSHLEQVYAVWMSVPFTLECSEEIHPGAVAGIGSREYSTVQTISTVDKTQYSMHFYPAQG